MKLGPIFRVLVGAVLLAVCSAAVWWVGVQIGKGALGASDSATFRSMYGFDGASLLAIFFLALVVTVTLQLVPTTGNKWPVLAAVAFGAGLVAERGTGSLTVALLVLAAAGVDEVKGTVPQLIAAALGGVLVAVPSVMESRLGTGASVGAALLRGLFFFLPLLALSPHLEKNVVKRLP